MVQIGLGSLLPFARHKQFPSEVALCQNLDCPRLGNPLHVGDCP